jgi:hypothetical protein
VDTADRPSDRRHGYPTQNIDHCVTRQHTHRAAPIGGREFGPVNSPASQ